MASWETIPWFHEYSPLLGVFVCKKQQYQGEIALATNLRPLMSEKLLKFDYILYCLNGEYISEIFFDIWSNFNNRFWWFFVKEKNFEIYQKKIDLTYLTGNLYCRFLHTKNAQERQAFMRSRNCFPWSHLWNLSCLSQATLLKVSKISNLGHT